MAHCLIRPESGPNRLPTMSTPALATCSTVCLRGRHAPERVPPWPTRVLPRATRCRTPYSSITERQSCPIPHPSLLALSLALWTHQSGATMAAAAEAPWSPRFRSGFSSGPTNPAYSFLHSRRTFPSSCFAGFAPAARRHRRRRRDCSLRAWPGHLGSSPTKLSTLVDMRGPPDAPPPIRRRRRAFSGRHR